MPSTSITIAPADRLRPPGPPPSSATASSALCGKSAVSPRLRRSRPGSSHGQLAARSPVDRDRALREHQLGGGPHVAERHAPVDRTGSLPPRGTCPSRCASRRCWPRGAGTASGPSRTSARARLVASRRAGRLGGVVALRRPARPRRRPSGPIRASGEPGSMASRAAPAAPGHRRPGPGGSSIRSGPAAGGRSVSSVEVARARRRRPRVPSCGTGHELVGGTEVAADHRERPGAASRTGCRAGRRPRRSGRRPGARSLAGSRARPGPRSMASGGPRAARAVPAGGLGCGAEQHPDDRAEPDHEQACHHRDDGPPPRPPSHCRGS